MNVGRSMPRFGRTTTGSGRFAAVDLEKRPRHSWTVHEMALFSSNPAVDIAGLCLVIGNLKLWIDAPTAVRFLGRQADCANFAPFTLTFDRLDSWFSLVT